MCAPLYKDLDDGLAILSSRGDLYSILSQYSAACCAQFEVRDFRLEAERNTPSACCGDFENLLILDSARGLANPRHSEGLGNLFIVDLAIQEMI